MVAGREPFVGRKSGRTGTRRDAQDDTFVKERAVERGRLEFASFARDVRIVQLLLIGQSASSSAPCCAVPCGPRPDSATHQPLKPRQHLL